MNTTSNHINDFIITPLGDGKFKLTRSDNHDDEIFYVAIDNMQNVRCECRAARQYRQRCVHIAEVLSYITKIVVLPEDAEIPDPLDVEQMENEAINIYILKLNKANNILTTKRSLAMERESQAVINLKHAKNAKSLLLRQKADKDIIEESITFIETCEDRKEETTLHLKIIGNKMEDIKSARISALVIQKNLQPPHERR